MGVLRLPTILRIGPYRFFFYSNENGEPAHIHIQRDKSLAKFWLKPVMLASSTRFSAKEIRELQKHVEKNRNQFLEAWNEYFKG
ncbi:DUF4160 domain-containing protein [Endozoicomonas gorgoniicola]|uniref:DUF4160 domain-containing protein n=1 Tax=Endozoicomonas gorgoniicola TaxID=1234144 RepID=UPI00389935B2